MALAVLTSSLAFGQTVSRETYQIKILGPAWQNQLPCMGIDDNNRVAGTSVNNGGGHVDYRAWTYDPSNGFLLSPEQYSTINAVSRDGTLAGSFFGTPTVFDWLGNATMVFPNIPGSFMAVNSHHDLAGYIFDANNNWIQTAVVYDHEGNWVTLRNPNTPMYAGSAAYGINDNGAVVGSAENVLGSATGFLWTGQMTYLPGPDGNSTVAVSINNNNEIVGYTVTPTDQVLPIRWVSTPSTTKYTVMALPTGYDSGFAGAMNGKGSIVGTMWSGQGLNIGRAFLWTPSRGLIDLNDLKAPNSRVYNLVSANAINESGSIAGIAEVNGQLRAYLAVPNTPGLGSGVTGW
jgi:uncharacterized membrane protein